MPAIPKIDVSFWHVCTGGQPVAVLWIAMFLKARLAYPIETSDDCALTHGQYWAVLVLNSMDVTDSLIKQTYEP